MIDPQDAPYIKCAECGGEVYKYGDMFTWFNKKGVETLICGDCLKEHLHDVSLYEAAELLGSRLVKLDEVIK